MEQKRLTVMERIACKIMSHLRYNENDEFYKCWQNDLILNVAYVVLGGRDPIDFVEWLLGDQPFYTSLNKLR